MKTLPFLFCLLVLFLSVLTSCKTAPAKPDSFDAMIEKITLNIINDSSED